MKYNPENGAIIGEDGHEHPIAFISRSAHERDPRLGHRFACADDAIGLLREFMAPWEGFTKDELMRRHLLGASDTPTLVRITRARALLARVDGEANP